MILGLDPANVTGWATEDGDFGTWQLAAKSDFHPGIRLKRLRAYLFALHRSKGISRVAFERASVGGGRNFQTIVSHAELESVIKLFSCEIGAPIRGWAPSTLKKWFTGAGNAKKHDVIAAVATRLGLSVLDDNVADALMILEMGRHFFGGKKA